jgi:NAD(P)-dependent dehydrogenase (short-subunit alcohol dehydrogenase family)
MDLGLEGKIAMVSGASRGIGRAVAEALAGEGVHLAISARSGDRLDKAATEIAGRAGVRVLTTPADLSRAEDAKTFTRRTMDEYGRIDILVNCAGSSQGGVFWEIPDQVWLDSWGLKLFGYVRLMREVVPHMIQQRSGRIVNIVGNSGKQPLPTILPGASANAALLTITKGLADAVARYGISVNAINPGPTNTERHQQLMERLGKVANQTAAEFEAELVRDIPMARVARPEEIADLAVFLASQRSGVVTGISITADGGMTRAMA